MNNEQLIAFKAWFDKFVAGFYGDNEYINANIKLKEEHSGRVCSEMLYLADQLHLEGNQRLLAETIALLHDVGRFPQFLKYQTYNDPKSVNHCLLGLEVLQKENILAQLSDDERQIIETAIRYHGEKELPNNLAGDTLLLSQMIRDADKLDIFNVVIKAYIQQRDDPDNFKLEMEMPDEPRCTPEVLDAILTGGRIDYKALRTMNDMKLCVLGWVYDVNFVPTLSRLKQRRHLETIFEFLPDIPDIRKVREKIFAYVEDRISRGG
ncbi:MAG: HD domain-containing protein [Sedimentisphaerales bacterium]|jgi:HD superfamily phosphohydrolase